MNVPPTDGIRVPVEDLRELVACIFRRVPIPEDHAQLIADLLMDTELRGVVSHGVRQVERYVRLYQEGKINTDPNVRVLKEGPVTTALSGDGGLGMIVATQAMHMAIAKAEEMGAGVATTTYHHHVGSSGKYVRMALREDMIGISFSGRHAAPKYNYQSIPVASLQGSPPLAFGMPSGPDHPTFLLDMASRIPWDEACFEKMPQVFFKVIGIAHVANILSGTLGGQMLPDFTRPNIQYTAADQSGFFMAMDIECFVPLQAFKDDMDHLMEEVSKMKPFPGFTEAALPGGRAWKKEREYVRDGIPISAAAMKSLKKLAGEFDLPVPWTQPFWIVE